MKSLKNKLNNLKIPKSQSDLSEKIVQAAYDTPQMIEPTRSKWLSLTPYFASVILFCLSIFLFPQNILEPEDMLIVENIYELDSESELDIIEMNENFSILGSL